MTHTLDAMLMALRAGGSPDEESWREQLGVENPLDRAMKMMLLASACLEGGSGAEARVLVQRAWSLSGQHPAIFPMHLSLSTEAKDGAAVREAHKRMGIAAARSGAIQEALGHFLQWHYTDVRLFGQDRYVYDQDILQAVRDMAAPFRLASRPSRGGPLRVAHLLSGATQFNSVIMRIAREFGRHHDKERIKAAFFIPESWSEVAQSPQGGGHLEYFGSHGWSITCAEDLPDEGQRLEGLGRAIHGFAPDVLLVHSALADFRPLFLMAMNVAPVKVGLIQGPPAQFAPPDLDRGIAWSWHPLMDTPVPCTKVDLEFDHPEARVLIPRSDLGIPEDALVFAAAGRHLKFKDPVFWDQIFEVLRTEPRACFMAIGPQVDQLAHLAGRWEAFRDRIIVVPWREDYLAVLGLADVMIDTLPSGSGVSLLDGMSLGIPVLSMANNYLEPMSQGDWTPAQEFLPGPEFVVRKGDWRGFQERLLHWLRDPEARAQAGRHCRAHRTLHNGQPVRMVRRCEAVLQEVAQARRGSGAPAPEGGPGRWDGTPAASDESVETPPGPSPAGATSFQSTAYIFQPDWNTAAWVEILLSYLEAFEAGDPVALVLPAWGEPGLEVAEDRVLSLLRRTGRDRFPDVILLSDPKELPEHLARYEVAEQVPEQRSNMNALGGAAGAAFRLARERMTAPL